MSRIKKANTAACLAARNLLIVVFCSSHALAQPVVGDFQPDQLSLGTIRVGATVEASVRIFGAGSETAGISVKTQPPRFVRVTQTQLATQEYGNLGRFVVCDVMVSLDTSRAGEFSGKIKVQIGEIEIEVPVAASILEPQAGLSRVLIVESPFNRFSTSDSSIFDNWLNLVKSAKLDVHYLEADGARPVLRNLNLSIFDVVLLADTGLHFAREADFAKLKDFVAGGGRVVIAANHFMSGSVAKANEFVVPFGLKMTDTEPQGASNVFEVEGEEILRHRLTAGVDILRFHRPSPVAVQDKKKGKILVAAPAYPDAGIVAVADAAKGQVVVLGISLWWNWIASKDEAGADNARLLRNLLTTQ
jgi:hypothetical protein